LAPLDFEIISKKGLFFQVRGVKNKFHHFWAPPGKNFGKIPYWPSHGKNPSDAHARVSIKHSKPRSGSTTSVIVIDFELTLGIMTNNAYLFAH